MPVPRAALHGRIRRRLRRELDQLGVGVAAATPTSAPTTLAIAELDDTGTASYRFYLDGTSATQLRPIDVPAGALERSRAFVFGGLGIVAEPSSTTIRGLLHAAPAELSVVFDTNCRPTAISDVAVYLRTVRECLERSDIVKVSVDDLHP